MLLRATRRPHQQSLERLPRHLARVEHVRVEAQGQGRVGVTEPFGCHLRRHVVVMPARSAPVSELMWGEVRNPGRLAGRSHRLLGAVDREAREDPPARRFGPPGGRSRRHRASATRAPAPSAAACSWSTSAAVGGATRLGAASPQTSLAASPPRIPACSITMSGSSQRSPTRSMIASVCLLVGGSSTATTGAWARDRDCASLGVEMRSSA